MERTALSAIAILITALLIGCSDGSGNAYDGTPVMASVSATISGGENSGSNAESFDSGDSIGISSEDGSYGNIKYTYGNGSFVPEGDPIYFESDDKVDFTAYHPYAESVEGGIRIDTGAENQTGERQKSIDFLYAKTTASRSDPSLDFRFHHAMSMITITFIEGLGIDFETNELTGYMLENLKLEGSFAPDTGIATVSGGPKELSIDLTEASFSGGEYKAPPIILIPQDVQDGVIKLTVTVNEQEYYAELNVENQKLEAGNNYIFKVRIKNSGLEITAEIAEWENGGEENINADM